MATTPAMVQHVLLSARRGCGLPPVGCVLQPPAQATAHPCARKPSDVTGQPQGGVYALGQSQPLVVNDQPQQQPTAGVGAGSMAQPPAASVEAAVQAAVHDVL
eukprot:scaffold157801_cov21-Tisochrysis_lutea.AAC.2